MTDLEPGDQYELAEREVILDEVSPDGRWSFVVYTTHYPSCLMVDVMNLDASTGLRQLRGAGIGPYPVPPAPTVTLRWDLPDGVCGVYIDGDCFGLFRCKRSRRRARGSWRAGMQLPFTEEEIAWFCAKTHVQFRKSGQDCPKCKASKRE